MFVCNHKLDENCQVELSKEHAAICRLVWKHKLDENGQFELLNKPKQLNSDVFVIIEKNVQSTGYETNQKSKWNLF